MFSYVKTVGSENSFEIKMNALYDMCKNSREKNVTPSRYEICIFVSRFSYDISRSSFGAITSKVSTLSMQMSASTEPFLQKVRGNARSTGTLSETFEQTSTRTSCGTQTAKWYVLKGPNRFTACGPVGSRVTYACPWGDLPQVSR